MLKSVLLRALRETLQPQTVWQNIFQKPLSVLATLHRMAGKLARQKFSVYVMYLTVCYNRIYC